MKVLFWYCDKFGWTPAIKILEEVEDASPAEHEKVVVAFVHVSGPDKGKFLSDQARPAIIRCLTLKNSILRI